MPGPPSLLHKVPDQALLCRQPNEYIKTLADMKVTLKELCWLLRDERRGLTELQQQFAKAKAAWETERAELKGHASQVSLPGLTERFHAACMPHPAWLLIDLTSVWRE